MIEARGLSKRFGRVQALAGVSFSLAERARAVLAGPSGSGKTTLLRLLAGLDLPDAGEVLLGGIPVSRPGWGVPPHLRGVGVVFQAPALWPHMRVADNVAFGFARLPRAERARRLEEVLARTGLADLARRFPDELSGGEARRVALARALAPRPRILLLDEPLTNLDQAARDQLLELLLKAVDASGCTLLYVTHQAEEAGLIGGELLELEGGRLVGAAPR